MPIQQQKIAPLTHLEFKVKQIVEGNISGIHKSPFHGFSVEFLEHRAFNTGDSTKNIDWKLFAKTGKYFIKKYEEETNLQLHVLLDVSGSMNFPDSDNQDTNKLNKLGFACYATGVLFQLAHKQRDAVSLSLFDNEIKYSSECKVNKSHHSSLFSVLNGLLDQPIQQTGSSTDLSEMINVFAQKIPKRSVVVIFTDLLHLDGEEKLEKLVSSLQHLKHRNNSVILYQLSDFKLEDEFDFGNKPVRLIDKETNEEIKLSPLEVKELFNKEKSKISKSFKSAMLQNNITHHVVDVNEGLEKMFLSTFK